MADCGVFPKQPGDIICLEDFNTIFNIVKEVKTDFYGAPMVSASLTDTLFVTTDHWNNLLADINYAVAIQGIPLETSITTKTIDILITADDINAYKAAADQIAKNKKPLWSVTATPAPNINEGQVITGTITAQFVADGTVVYWKILPWTTATSQPIVEADIVGGSQWATPGKIYEVNRMFNVDADGKYYFIYAADNSMEMYVDGVLIGQTSNSYGRNTPTGSTGGTGGGGGGGGCPSPDMKILLSSGQTIRAGDISVGQEVYTRHELTNEMGSWPVTAVETMQDNRWIVRFNDDREFIGTYNHRMLSNGGWVEIQNLKSGDVIYGEPDAVVVSAEPYDYGPVVKITVQDAHTYISQGLISHNVKNIDSDFTKISNFSIDDLLLNSSPTPLALADPNVELGEHIAINLTAGAHRLTVKYLNTPGGTPNPSGYAIAIYKEADPTYSMIWHTRMALNDNTVPANTYTSYPLEAVDGTGIDTWGSLIKTYGVDVLESALQGQVTMANNSAVFTRTIREDGLTEGVESLMLAIYSDAGYTTQLATSEIVYIQDTSTEDTGGGTGTGTGTSTFDAGDAGTGTDTGTGTGTGPGGPDADAACACGAACGAGDSACTG